MLKITSLEVAATVLDPPATHPHPNSTSIMNARNSYGHVNYYPF